MFSVLTSEISTAQSSFISELNDYVPALTKEMNDGRTYSHFSICTTTPD